MPPENVHLSDEIWVRAAQMLRPDQDHCATCVAGMKDKARRGVGIRPVHVGCTDHARHTPVRACATACGHACEDGPVETSGRAAACDSHLPTALPGPMMSALACKGIKELLIVGMPPTRMGGGAITLPPLSLSGELATPSSDTQASRTLDAEDPPPRRAVVAA